LLNRIEILVDKGLHGQAKKLLKKAKDMAITYEKMTYIPEINLMEQSVYRMQYNVGDLRDNSDNLIEEIEQCAMKIKNMAEYEDLKNRLYIQRMESGVLRNEKEIKSFDWVLKSTLLKNEKQALSLNAKVLYYELFASYYNYIEDSEKCYEYSLKLIGLIEANPHIIETNVNFPTQFLYRHSVQCYNIGKYHEALEYISRMEILKPKSDIQKLNILLKAYNTKLNVYFRMGNMKKCLSLIPEIENLLEKNKNADKLLKEIVYWQITSLLIIAEEYKQALKWLVKANTAENSNIRQDLECIGRIMEIVLHYELGKFDIMEYRIKSTYRFLASKQKLYQLEKVILTSIRKLIEVRSKAESLAFFRQLRFELEPIVKDPLEEKFLTYFDIMSWLESKTEKKKLADVVKSKLKPLRV
jgi:tetratricopeptide (TPR) repeat protein